jgi:hypothetical protein
VTKALSLAIGIPVGLTLAAMASIVIMEHVLARKVYHYKI